MGSTVTSENIHLINIQLIGVMPRFVFKHLIAHIKTESKGEQVRNSLESNFVLNDTKFEFS